MSELFDPCNELASEASCAKAKGWPSGPQILPPAAGTPEASVTGYWVGDQYFDTDNEILYVFNGTPGANTGWVAINP